MDRIEVTVDDLSRDLYKANVLMNSGVATKEALVLYNGILRGYRHHITIQKPSEELKTVATQALWGRNAALSRLQQRPDNTIDPKELKELSDLLNQTH